MTADLTHPGPALVELPERLRDEVVAYARTELPNEACGLIVGDRPAPDGGRALRWEPARNGLQSPYRYEIHPDDLFRLSVAIDDAGEAIWAIVHSHVASPGRPSPTDLRDAHYPDSLYVLVSLDPGEADASTGEPSVRAWRIVDGAAHEVALIARDEVPA